MQMITITIAIITIIITINRPDVYHFIIRQHHPHPHLRSPNIPRVPIRSFILHHPIPIHLRIGRRFILHHQVHLVGQPQVHQPWPNSQLQMLIFFMCSTCIRWVWYFCCSLVALRFCLLCLKLFAYLLGFLPYLLYLLPLHLLLFWCLLPLCLLVGDHRILPSHNISHQLNPIEDILHKQFAIEQDQPIQASFPNIQFNQLKQFIDTYMPQNYWNFKTKIKFCQFRSLFHFQMQFSSIFPYLKFYFFLFYILYLDNFLWNIGSLVGIFLAMYSVIWGI